MAKKKNNFYAYLVPVGGGAAAGKTEQGIVDNWPTCEKKVSGKYGARFKGFETREQAEAWLAGGAQYDAKPIVKLQPGIYFDAGTGRGDGVEISVTDEHGKNLLHKALSKSELNQHGKHLIANEAATNNYGELLALSYALEIAKKMKVKHIFGDSSGASSAMTLRKKRWSLRWKFRKREKNLNQLAARSTASVADTIQRTWDFIDKKLT
jgi:ribonuclease HI